MPRLLITGANGFIGRHILPLLKDWEVHAISRFPQAQLAENSISWHPLDLFDENAVKTLVQAIQPSHLLHLAWEARPGIYWTSRDNYRWLSSSLALLDAFESAGGKRAVLAGTCAEYRWHSARCIENETPLSYDTPYAASKSSLSHLALSFAQQSGLSLAWARIFFPYGLHEAKSRLIPSIIQAILKGETVEIRQGNEIRDFLYISDVAALFFELLQSDFQGIINVGSGDALALGEIGHKIAEILEAPQLLKIHDYPETPSRAVADTRLLTVNFDWKPQFTLEDGLLRTIEWWKSQAENS